MKNENEKNQEDIKPDLKHDTMEYAASADGDDILDMDDENADDDGITAEELDILEVDGLDEQAAALNSVEMDRNADSDVIFNENDKEAGYEENRESSDKMDDKELDRDL